jgi:hypothetical protein
MFTQICTRTTPIAAEWSSRAVDLEFGQQFKKRIVWLTKFRWIARNPLAAGWALVASLKMSSDAFQTKVMFTRGLSGLDERFQADSTHQLLRQCVANVQETGKLPSGIGMIGSLHGEPRNEPKGALPKNLGFRKRLPFLEALSNPSSSTRMACFGSKGRDDGNISRKDFCVR